VRRFFEEVFNRHDQAAASELISADFVAYHPAFPEGIRGPEGIMQTTYMFRAGFPDLRYEPQDLVAEGDRVAVRWTAHGTHSGPFMGVPPSGKQATITGLDIFRVSGNQLVEAWVNSDFLGLMQQIGGIPSPGRGG
jgi:steroid delta-isomerase-like uncharacterized protein